ncbi:MAG: SBBP repeat-containing protein, partial [Comamonas sp.]
VAPGKSPDAIRLRFAGADRLSVDADGNLHIAAAGGELVQHKPVVYQERDGQRQPVEGAFKIGAGQEVAFALGDYDRSQPLVIDPTLDYSTYLGGSGTGADYGRGIAVDGDGAAYVIGYTTSTDYPTTSGAYQTALDSGYDVFVTKVSDDGSSLEYSTYIGGSGADYGRAIAVDDEGAAYIIGYTASSDFPVTSGSYQTTSGGGSYDGFAAKLSADGSSLTYSTYIGGSGSDYLRSLALADDGSVYLGGYTGSSDFPTTSGAYQTALSGSGDAVVLRLDASGSSLVFSTLLGGSEYEYIYDNSLKVDSAGAVYVAGITSSSDFPVTASALQTSLAGDYDSFVAKLSADASSVTYATYIGGSAEEDNYGGLAVDDSGYVYVAGYTASTDFPVTSSAYQTTRSNASSSTAYTDMYVSKLKTDLSGLVYSTYIGGSSYEYLYGLAVDDYGYAYGFGYSYAGSTLFPTTSDAYQTSGNGGYDTVVFKLSKDGSTLKYSTFLGGGSTDRGYGMGFAGNAVYGTGQTLSTDFPTTSGAYQTSNSTAATYYANYLYKLAFNPISLSPNTIDFGNVVIGVTSDATTVTVTNTSDDAVTIASAATSSSDFAVASDACTGTTLAATDDSSTDDSCTLTVTATPSAAGSSSGTLSVTTGDDTTVSIDLSATGTPLELSTTAIAFGSVAVGDSVEQAMTVTNVGDDTVTISSVTVDGIFAQSSDCVTSLAAGSSCTITVSATATSAGTFSGTVTIVSDSSSSPDTVSLTLTGTGSSTNSSKSGGGALGGGLLLMLGSAALLRRRRAA